MRHAAYGIRHTVRADETVLGHALLRRHARRAWWCEQVLQLVGHQSKRRLGDMPYEEMEKWTRWATHVAMLDRYENMTQVRRCYCSKPLALAAAVGGGREHECSDAPWCMPPLLHTSPSRNRSTRLCVAAGH